MGHMKQETMTEQALVLALREAAKKLKDRDASVSADARGARQLQDETRDLVALSRNPVVRLHSFLLSTLIEDVFYNLFGDTPYNAQTENARRDICFLLSDLFNRLADSITTHSPAEQLKCWEAFVNAYLDNVENVNQALKGGQRP